MTQYDIVFSGRLSASLPTLGIGYVVCLDAAGQFYVAATSANLALAGGSAHGVVLTDASTTNPAVTVQSSGPLSAAYAPYVGVGAVSAVGPDTLTGKLVRVADDASNIIGDCDAHGNCRISLTGKGGSGSSIPGLNPKNFGCPWDGIHDDLPGFSAMLASLPKVVTNLGGGTSVGGAKIYLPSGIGYFSDNLLINRTVEIVGAAGGEGGTNSTMSFAAGKGIWFQNYNTSADGAGSGFASIKRVTLASTRMSQFASYYNITNVRTPSTFFEKGRTVQAGGAGNTACFFRVTTKGTTSSGGDPPAFTTAVTPGVTITDGSLTWTSEAMPHDRLLNHAYTLGQRIYIPGDTRYYFECVQAGTSANKNCYPLYPGQPLSDVTGPDFTSPGMPFQTAGPTVDGGVLWAVKLHAGIITSEIHINIEDIFFAGFRGFAVHNQSATAVGIVTNSDFGMVSGGHAEWCGGGVLLYGFDANAYTVNHFESISCGDAASGYTDIGGQYGCGAIGIWDNGLANRFYGNYAQNNNSPAFVSAGVSTAVWAGNHSECAYDSVFCPTAIVLNNDPFQSVSGHTQFASSNQGQNIGSTNYGVTPNVAAGQLTSGPIASAHWLRSVDEGVSQLLAWEYNDGRAMAQGSPSGYSVGAGWYTLNWGPYNNFGVVSISGSAAAEGEGWWRVFEGTFCGGTSPYWAGNNTNTLGWGQLKGGSVGQGDRWTNANLGAPGNYDTVIAQSVTNGATARAWGPGVLYWQRVTTGTYSGHNADVVVPVGSANPIPTAGTKVFRVQSVVGGTNGSSGGVEPNWALAPAIGNTIVDNTITWVNIGVVPAFAATNLVVMQGTLPLAATTALTVMQAAYECIAVSFATAVITVTAPRDGQILKVYNSSGGNITVVGFVVAAGQLLTALYVGAGINAWKKESLF